MSKTDKDNMNVTATTTTTRLNTIGRNIESLAGASTDATKPSLMLADATDGVGKVVLAKVKSSDSSVTFSYVAGAAGTEGAGTLDIKAVGSGSGGAGVTVTQVDLATTTTKTISTNKQVFIFSPSSASQTAAATIILDPTTFTAGASCRIVLNNTADTNTLVASPAIPLTLSLANATTSTSPYIVYGQGKKANTSIQFLNFGDGIELYCTDAKNGVFTAYPIGGNPNFVSGGSTPTSVYPSFVPYVDFGLASSGVYTPGSTAVRDALTGCGATAMRAAFLNWVPSFMGNVVTWSGSSDPINSSGNEATMIKGMQTAGINVGVSFGGAAGTSLGFLSGDTTSAVNTQIVNVLTAYPGVDLDFDVEGANGIGATSASGWANLCGGIAAYQAAHPTSTTKFTLTIQSAPNDFSIGQIAVTAAAAAGAKIARINLMCMDYGNPNIDMSASAQTQAAAAFAWIQTNQSAWLTTLGAKAVGDIIQVTVMIGQNDTPSEVFGCNTPICKAANVTYPSCDSNAQTLYNWAKGKSVSLGIWTLFRDVAAPVGTTLGVAGTYLHSGIADMISGGYQFSKTFSGQRTDWTAS